MPPSPDPLRGALSGALRGAISAAHRPAESAWVAALAAEYRQHRPDPAAVAERARQLVQAVRRQRRGASGVDHLMHEFSLSSQEGVALMCLAEALLRIPDHATADRLIRDKLGRGDWQSHLGHSDSLFVNAAAWGLLITGKLVAEPERETLAGTLTGLVAKGGEPLIRRGVDFAMELLGRQFVMGEQIEAALARSREREARGYRHSFDMLGEAALTAADAARYEAAYAAAIEAIGRAGGGRGVYAGPGLSLKLSALHPRYCRAQKERVMAELLPRLKGLLLLARRHDIGVNIDAEESERLELSLDLLEALAPDPDLAGWNGLGFVIQAYQKRCPALVDYLADLARRSGRRLMVRLVKGAYWDSEIKRAQVEGQADYPVYTRKVHTDLAYLACARRLLEAPADLYPQFATHNAHTLAAVEALARERGIDDYEFQCLHGMGEPLYDHLTDAAHPCRIYAPVGSHQTLLPYLVRRLLENGANSSFVNRLVDETVSIETLVADPLEQVLAAGTAPHPQLPLPPDLYAPRRNAAGLDLNNDAVLADLESHLAALDGRRWQAAPRLDGTVPPPREARPVCNPADRTDLVGQVQEATPAEARQAVARAVAEGGRWRHTSPGRRAQALERGAELLESHQAEIISLCIREAGKTWPNALAELREAVDFCRYYAGHIRQLDATAGGPVGPVVCISPWNFPLAIFLGQIGAALAAGHPVIAKPAAQTSLIAALAVGLLHRAGIPPASLQLLPGRGKSVGDALSADPRVRGVLFTGSTDVARHIARRLAERQGAGAGEPLFVAETGGQNAMIVDSSALPEQVVQDILSSGFDSAGQRCSALRVLCLQEEIAEPVTALLRQAMAELALGNPRRLATDVGPVIDAEARAQLEAHIDSLAGAGHPVWRQPLPPACGAGTFVAPTLIEIDRLEQLRREVFGPVVHVLRYRAEALDALIDAINATGYGLTFGIHSRIDTTVARATARIRAGNLYVNRNMVGAVVGVQPFGGEGLSGTGPKAGGPLLLHRLLGSENVTPASLGAASAPDAPGSPTADALSALAALAAWALTQGRGDLYRRCTDDAALSLAGRSLALPGPTGERNTLGFFPRGTVLCLGPDAGARLQQIAAALATGNRPVLPDDAISRELKGQLPPVVARHLEPVAAAPLPAAVLCAEPQQAAGERRRLAALPGPLVPVIEPAPGGGYPLYRLVLERVVSVNTTAAGGNTRLMSLAG